MWQFVTDAIGAFFNSLRGLLPGIVGRVMLALGVGVSSYQFLMPEILTWIQGYFNALGPDALAMLGALNVDKAFNLIISAIAVKFSMKLTPIRLNNPP